MNGVSDRRPVPRFILRERDTTTIRIKEYLLKTVAVLLCVVMAAILVALFFMNHTRKTERANDLKKQIEELARQEAQKKEDAADLYYEFVTGLTVRDIVCWGDNEMAGNDESSLPKTLREVANEKLFAGVTTDFTNFMDKEAEPALSVTVNNLGVRNEGMREILVRAGVNELQLAQWTAIPSDTDPHNVELKDDISWTTLRFAEQGNVQFGDVDIDGVFGSLTVGDGEYDEDHPRFAFARDEEGDSASFGAGTRIEIASATDYIGDIPVFFFEDDSAESVSGFVGDLERLVERYTEYDADEDGTEGATDTEAAQEEPSATRAYVVICTAEEDSDLDAALKEAFGDQYIRNDTYAYEMSEDNYRTLAEKVFEILDSQGCFDDVKRQTGAALEKLGNL